MASIKILVSNARAAKRDVTHITIESFSYIEPTEIDEDGNPELVLIRKIEALAEMLGCSEAEAQRLLFERC